MTTIGPGDLTCSAYVNSRTYIDLSTPSTSSGIVECVGVRTPPGGVTGISAKIKIFRDDGTNYLFIDEENITLDMGKFNICELSGDLSIQSGDQIGIYTPSSGPPGYDSLCLGVVTGGSVYKTSDIITNTLKSTWTTDSTDTPGIIGYFSYYVKTSGNDGNDGLSWTNAWATMNKAATTVSDRTTIHIGFGTYNAEPAGNKIAPQNAGSSGIKYLCETATTGGGTGSVIVEKN